MPKLTFYNLPADKQERLLCAARDEFSRVPVFEASISNIVKAAGIPRGSFYQYFEDKEDLYYHLLEDLAEMRRKQFLDLLKECEGDLFEAVLGLYIRTDETRRNPEIVRHAFLNLNHRAETTFSQVFSNENNEETLKELMEAVDMKKLNAETGEDVARILKILTAVTLRSFVERHAKNMSCDEASAQFRQELELLKRGLGRS